LDFERINSKWGKRKNHQGKGKLIRRKCTIQRTGQRLKSRKKEMNQKGAGGNWEKDHQRKRARETAPKKGEVRGDTPTTMSRDETYGTKGKQRRAAEKEGWGN